MAANSPATGTGVWQLVSGSALINDLFDPATSISNLGAGANVFEWNMANGLCADDSAQVTLTIDNTPPTAVCNDVTIDLDGTGNATINPETVGTGSADALSLIHI